MLIRTIGILCYLALAVVVLAFIFSNRAPVTIELFPFTTITELPLYLVLSAIFVVGLGLGLLHSACVWFRMQRALKRASRAIAGLEKEIAAHKAPGV